MEEALISIETAKLARDKGFDEIVDCIFERAGKMTVCRHHNSSIEASRKWYSAPKQTLLQKWLREIHELDVNVLSYASSPRKYFISIYKYTDLNFIGELYNTTDRFDAKGNKKKQLFFNSYEEALENGLIKALKLIK